MFGNLVRDLLHHILLGHWGEKNILSRDTSVGAAGEAESPHHCPWNSATAALPAYMKQQDPPCV